MAWKSSASFVYHEIKAFFSSGVFYIGLGCAFLWSAYNLLNETHSAFVFLLAVLGIAIVLYGTGTQAVGSGNTGAINVAIAGGAGVLAALFGFGVVTYQKGIEEVFKRTQDYAVLDLYAEGVTGDLTEFDISAKIGTSSQLPLFHDSRRITILVPIVEDEPQTKVVVTLVSRSELADYQQSREVPVDITWAQEQVRRRSGLNNEVVPEISRPLALVSAQLQVPSLSEDNESGGPASTIAPQ